MKFLLVNELQIGGGAEIYVDYLTQILEGHRHSVERLFLARSGREYQKRGDADTWLIPPLGRCEKIIINPLYIRRLRKFIEEKNPDVIVLNNAFSAPLSQYLSLMGWPVIQVVHDYSPVCPKSTCIRGNGSLCDGISNSHCIFTCKYHNSFIQIVLKYALTLCVNFLRKHMVDYFITPSEMLRRYLGQIRIKSVAIPNPMKINEKPREFCFCEPHRYIYIGALNENKGIYELLPAFHECAQKKNIELHLYGKITERETQLFMQKYVQPGGSIFYHGFVSHDIIKEVLQEAYALLVPSKWMENYPTTVMEGMMHKVLVIGSDRGGIPEQLSDARGMVFRFGRHELCDCILRAESLSYHEYQEITNRAYEYVRTNNSSDIYYHRFMKIVKELLKDRKGGMDTL